MVDIAGAAAGPQLFSRPDPLLTGAQASQLATETIAPEQASGVTASGNIDAEGEETGGQNEFENPASGENRIQAQLEAADWPPSPIEEALRDFPPNAVVRPAEEEAAEEQAGFASNAVVTSGREADDAAPPARETAEGAPAEFGVTEAEAEEQQAAARQQAAADQVREEGGQAEEPQTTLAGASDDPYGLVNGAAGDARRPQGQPATQPSGAAVDIAA